MLQKYVKKGTCHGTDCMHLFRVSIGLPTPELTEEFKKTISKHVKIWTKFALTGDPNTEELGVTWDRDSLSNPCYMDIGTDWTLREGVPFADRINFWLHLKDKYCKD